MTNLTHHLALTGHRPNKLGGYDITTPGYLALQKALEAGILKRINARPDHTIVCHSGLALGADTIWSKAILAVRDQYPERVRFIAHVPMMQQSRRWFKKSDTDFWQEQVDRADEVIVYGDLTGNYTSHHSGQLMKKRNMGMVDACDELFAIYDGTHGGTGHAVNYARKTNKAVIVAHPDRFFK